MHQPAKTYLPFYRLQLFSVLAHSFSRNHDFNESKHSIWMPLKDNSQRDWHKSHLSAWVFFWFWCEAHKKWTKSIFALETNSLRLTNAHIINDTHLTSCTQRFSYTISCHRHRRHSRGRCCYFFWCAHLIPSSVFFHPNIPHFAFDQLFACVFVCVGLCQFFSRCFTWFSHPEIIITINKLKRVKQTFQMYLQSNENSKSVWQFGGSKSNASSIGWLVDLYAQWKNKQTKWAST